MYGFTRSFCVTTLAAIGLVASVARADGGGNVMPATASPHGYSLFDMAGKLALFNTYGNDLKFYPQTPFQILYQDLSKASATPITCPANSFPASGSGRPQ